MSVHGPVHQPVFHANFSKRQCFDARDADVSACLPVGTAGAVGPAAGAPVATVATDPGRSVRTETTAARPTIAGCPRHTTVPAVAAAPAAPGPAGVPTRTRGTAGRAVDSVAAGSARAGTEGGTAPPAVAAVAAVPAVPTLAAVAGEGAAQPAGAAGPGCTAGRTVTAAPTGAAVVEAWPR